MAQPSIRGQMTNEVDKLTLWFPPRHGGADTTLNLDCESSRQDRDKRLAFESRA